MKSNISGCKEATMGILYTIQPDDLEPVEFTHFDCWDESTTWAGIARAWGATLGVTLPEEDAPDLIILELLRKGFDVYEGDEFIEVYDLQGDL
jgi:hypothetical protein